MIECLAGLLIGWLAGLIFKVGISGWNGAVALIVFAVLADELIACSLDAGRSPLAGLLRKAFFCYAALMIEQISRTPLTPFLILVLFGSLFWRTVFQVRGRPNAGWEA